MKRVASAVGEGSVAVPLSIGSSPGNSLAGGPSKSGRSSLRRLQQRLELAGVAALDEEAVRIVAIG